MDPRRLILAGRPADESFVRQHNEPRVVRLMARDRHAGATSILIRRDL